MPTIPTGKMERELRALYLRWLSGVSLDSKNVFDKVDVFERQSQELIEKLGGRVASLGALADFPVPKRLDLSPHVGTIYSDMKQAAIQAGMSIGLGAADVARQMFNAGMDKSFNRLNRLARTETVSAYWKNAWDSIADLPALVMVWGSEDGPRTCQWCRERDGLVMDSSGLRDHPNGRCTPIPTLRSEVKYKGSVDSGGRIYNDPDWNKKPQSSPTVALEGVGTTTEVGTSLSRGPLDASVHADKLSDNFYIEGRSELLRKTETRVGNLAANFKETAEAFKAKVSANLQAVVDKATPTVMVNKGALSKILDEGFKSTYDTKSGIGAKGGLLDYKRYMNDRKEMELIVWGDDVHPIYGFLNTGKVSRDLDLYGDVQVVLKDSIKDRSTVSFGDSLNQGNNLIPGPARAVDHHVVKQQYLGDARIGTDPDNFIDSYIEIQMPAVGPDDIAKVVFSTEPSATIQKKLAAKGIPWELDTRKDNPWR